MIRVLLAQLPVPNNPATNVPLAAGYLKAYAQAQGLLDQVELDILPRRIADTAGDALLVEAIVAHAPDVLGFSLYTWNSERSLAIAQRVKQRLPNLLVVGGGPEVQPDNAWLLQHPALDIGVIGEGEQTFAALLRRVIDWRSAQGDAAWQSLAAERSFSIDNLDGLVFRRDDELLFTAARVALDDLAVIPSPYLAGYLELAPNGIAMVEVSRWCPYACSFCLYGRNMGAKLGRRYFGIERVLAEIAWAKAHGATAIHFVEANLNLVPFFRPLMSALSDLNADRTLAFYAELRGEHL
ncbi:MAG: cobalamin-dependent protein, partial [Chloroflexales bacterium]|nr:cobalamin-dependent protein [Chloroflexales bacterium]